MHRAQARVLHVAEAFGGGLFEAVRIMANGAARAGHDVVVAHGVRPETPGCPAEHFDPAVRLVCVEGWQSRSLRSQPAALRELRSVARAAEPDLVHLHSSVSGVIGAVALRGIAPTVLTPHAFAATMDGHSRLKRIAFSTLERYATRRANVLGACSVDEARVARGYGAREIATIANGIPELDADKVVVRDALPSRPRVVAMGRTVPQRQPEAVARIPSQLGDEADVEWVGGGGGEPGEPGRAALEAAGVATTGWVPRETVLERLQTASIYVHWTAWDGLPLSILEAMAKDVIVVASDIGPNREAVGPAQVCSTEEEAVELIRRIIDEPTLAASLLAEQRRRRLAFSARRMIGDWLELYAGLGLERRRVARVPVAMPAPELAPDTPVAVSGEDLHPLTAPATGP